MYRHKSPSMRSEDSSFWHEQRRIPISRYIVFFVMGLKYQGITERWDYRHDSICGLIIYRHVFRCSNQNRIHSAIDIIDAEVQYHLFSVFCPFDDVHAKV
jgi:hypothetical protein